MKAVTVSAPHRIEFGGFWDLKAFGLICQSLNPCTVNIAISARTQLTLRPYEADMVRISDRYHSEECNLCDADLNSHFGLVLAVAMHFQSRGKDPGAANLNMVNCSLKGLTPLPPLDDLTVQLQERGFNRITTHRLMPGSTFCGVSAGRA